MGGCLTRRIGFPTGGVTDPSWSSVVLLAEFDEANGSTTWTDKTGRHTLTASGTAQSSTNNPPAWQSTSLQLPGTSGNDISIADSADWNFSNGDFTVEYFARRSTTSTGGSLCQFGTTDKGWGFFEDTTLGFFWSTDGTTNSSITANFTTGGAWKHRAFSRVGNTGYLCFDGTIIASGSLSGITLRDSARPLVVGGNSNGTSAMWDGNMAALRATKGVGRYSGSVSSSYTVPSHPYPSH